MPASRFAYQYNPACACGWCQNGGQNPTPGAPASLGYDEAHCPPTGLRFDERPVYRPPLRQVA